MDSRRRDSKPPMRRNPAGCRHRHSATPPGRRLKNGHAAVAQDLCDTGVYVGVCDMIAMRDRVVSYGFGKDYFAHTGSGSGPRDSGRHPQNPVILPA